MTQAGYDKKLEEFEKIKEKLKETSKNKITAAYDGSGDGWHDNFTYEQLDLQEEGLIERLRGYQEFLERVVIIEKDELNENQVNIGDQVLIQIVYEDGDREELMVLLDDASLDEHAVSLASPLGKVLYKGEIGQEYYYEVRDIKNKVIIKDIVSKMPSN